MFLLDKIKMERTSSLLIFGQQETKFMLLLKELSPQRCSEKIMQALWKEAKCGRALVFQRERSMNGTQSQLTFMIHLSSRKPKQISSQFQILRMPTFY